jgi:hypothetical protein
MATFRKGQHLGFVSKTAGENWAHAIFFGQNVCWERAHCGRVIRVGDPVNVLSRLEHRSGGL